jgi:hypothetical protein
MVNMLTYLLFSDVWLSAKRLPLKQQISTCNKETGNKTCKVTKETFGRIGNIWALVVD